MIFISCFLKTRYNLKNIIKQEKGNLKKKNTKIGHICKFSKKKNHDKFLRGAQET